MELEAITISNFRSIRGSLTIPLDAPVVLIHGLNGAGKTSVLAAMELALTGQFAGSVPPQPGILVEILSRPVDQDHLGDLLDVGVAV